jgi:hypothetical protein
MLATRIKKRPYYFAAWVISTVCLILIVFSLFMSMSYAGKSCTIDFACSVLRTPNPSYLPNRPFSAFFVRVVQYKDYKWYLEIFTFLPVLACFSLSSLFFWRQMSCPMVTANPAATTSRATPPAPAPNAEPCSARYDDPDIPPIDRSSAGQPLPPALAGGFGSQEPIEPASAGLAFYSPGRLLNTLVIMIVQQYLAAQSPPSPPGSAAFLF